jgi:hypothetical protein
MIPRTSQNSFGVCNEISLLILAYNSRIHRSITESFYEYLKIKSKSNTQFKMSTSEENICKILIVSIQIRIFSLIPEFGYYFDNSS